MPGSPPRPPPPPPPPCACATVVTATNITATITTIRIIFFIASAPKGVVEIHRRARIRRAILRHNYRQDRDISYGCARTRATTNFVSDNDLVAAL